MNKRILLFMRNFRPVLFEAILKNAHIRNWSVEYYHSHIPDDWFGDGAIIDYINPESLKYFQSRKIPVATRYPIVTDNLASIYGDIERNINMVFEFFRKYGHHKFALINFQKLLYNDPVAYMESLAKKAGMEFYSLYWEDHLPESMTNNFVEIIKTVRNFLIELPKPCAVYLGSVQHVHVVYLACQQAKLTIGKEIALVANTDDPGFAENLTPPVTTLDGEFPATGKALVEELEKLMQGRPAPKEILLVPATKIVPRESTDMYAVKHPAVMKAIDYILENYSNPQITLEKIVNAAQCSVRMLQLNFKKYLYILPAHFLQDIRLQKAAELLEKTHLTREQIAQKVGYGSGISMTLAFKKKYGMTPGAYRKSL